jgi:hypothetical protein
MFYEKDFEDIICKYPELIEDDLKFIGRQVTLYGRRMDVLFEDRFKRNLIIELKAGPIKDEHIGQILSYEGMLLSADDPSIRVMLVGTRVPPNIQRSLDHHGIAWREVPHSKLKAFITEKNDQLFLKLFDDNEPNLIDILHKQQKKISYGQKIDTNSTPYSYSRDELIAKLKTSECYKAFKKIFTLKLDNELKANRIFCSNLGKLKHEHIREIITLIDEPYPYNYMGKINKGPWFGRLLKPNALNIFNTELDKINKWFNILTNNDYHVEKRIELLLNELNNIKGLNVGFITLMLYILDKTKYLIWFQSQHEGLTIIYPDLEKFKGYSNQYSTFNILAQEFAKEYGFEHTELDWIFSTGLPIASSMPSLLKNNEISQVWVGLDQSKYTIERIFEIQKASDIVERILLSFHLDLTNQLNQKSLDWVARTNIRGITYMCNYSKVFIYVDVFQQFISTKFFTGNSNIEGIRKANWVTSENYQGSETFRIVDDDSLKQAVQFALKAYEIAMNWAK